MLLRVKASGGRVWGLPGNAHSEILPVVSDCLPLMDELCKRSMKFTNGCVVSECAVVLRLATFALLVGRMNSILGRNAIFFSVRYGLDTCDVEPGNTDISCLCTFCKLFVSMEL